MATSSIFSNIHIQNQIQAEEFFNALEESEKKLENQSDVKISQELVNNFPSSVDIKKLLEKRFSVK